MQFGPNHWIPYTEAEVGARERFASHFMTDFMAGRIRGRVCPKRVAVEKDGSNSPDAIETIASTDPCHLRLNFSPAAQAVLAAGRELWRYYYAQSDADPNASYYDIRAHFQGRKPNGTMNATSVVLNPCSCRGRSALCRLGVSPFRLASSPLSAVTVHQRSCVDAW